jgi:hypothetical protein
VREGIVSREDISIGRVHLCSKKERKNKIQREYCEEKEQRHEDRGASLREDTLFH